MKANGRPARATDAAKLESGLMEKTRWWTKISPMTPNPASTGLVISCSISRVKTTQPKATINANQLYSRKLKLIPGP